jgi:hypothetical protein
MDLNLPTIIMVMHHVSWVGGEGELQTYTSGKFGFERQAK